MWEIWREFSGDFFRPTEQRLKNFGEIFGAFFVRKFVARKKSFVARKKSFVQNSLCRRATLIILGWGGTWQKPQELAGGFRAQESRTLANFHKSPGLLFRKPAFDWEQTLLLGKTKTLQTVTLRVAILSDFSARRLSQNFGAKLKQKSAQVRAVFSWKFAGTELSLAVLPFAVF